MPVVALNLRPLAEEARARTRHSQGTAGGAAAPVDTSALGNDDLGIPALSPAGGGRYGRGQRAGDDGYDNEQVSLNPITDFTLGCIMGFFLGFLVFIWMCGSNISRQQRRGVLVGMSLNILLTLMKQSNAQAGTGSGGP